MCVSANISEEISTVLLIFSNKLDYSVFLKHKSCLDKNIVIMNEVCISWCKSLECFVGLVVVLYFAGYEVFCSRCVVL